MFLKRIKKSNHVALLETKEEDNPETVLTMPKLARNHNVLPFHKKPEQQKHGSLLEKKFSAKDKPMEINDPNKDVLENSKVNIPNKWSFLPYLQSDDEESKILRKIISHGQTIIQENVDKPAWNTGIIELEIGLTDRLHTIDQCEDCFYQHLDQIIEEKLFQNKLVLIPEEDVIAKGDIFVVPKFKEKEMIRSQKSTKERVRDFLKGN